jgi:MFS family permease
MLLVVLARDLGLSAGAIGLFFTTTAVGSLVGALIARPLARRIGQGPAIWAGPAATAPFTVALPMVQQGWLLWLAAICHGVFWAGVTVYNITQVSFRQAITPERLLGRMNATMRFIVWGTMPVGALVSGFVAESTSARTALWIGAVGATTAFVPTLLSPLRSMTQLPRTEQEDVRLAVPGGRKDAG